MIKNSLKKAFYNMLNLDKAVLESTDTKIKEHGFASIEDFDASDVFIAAYPKSGNTWIQNLVSGLLLDSTSEYLAPQLVSEMIPDIHAKKYYKRCFKRMIFKTHSLPLPEFRKVIHLVRDGRDAMVSYYFMNRNKNADYPYSLRDMVVDGKGISPSKWNYHTRVWSENPYGADILVVRYEDLHEFPLQELRRICQFIDVQISENRMLEIYQNNTIDSMRKRVEKYGMDNDHTWTHKPITSFFRKGEIGSYKEEMPKELIEYFDKEAYEELKVYRYI